MAKSARQVPRVKVISRHRSECGDKAKGKSYIRCACPKALYWYEGGQERVTSADTTDYQEAERKAFTKQASFEAVAAGTPEHTTVNKAVDLYLKGKKTSGYTQKSLDRLELLFRERMETFLTQRGVLYLKDITAALVEEWRATWTGAPQTKGKYQGRVKGFFEWAVSRDLIDKNPALGLERIKGAREVAPTVALADEQFQKLLDSVDRLPHRDAEELRHFRALMLLQRWSGLSIKDALTIERIRFRKTASGWYRLFLRRAKTGVDVYVSLSPEVAGQILAIKPASERYLFWNGKQKLEVMINKAALKYRRVGELAELKDEHGQPLAVHSHMMRDTFAVWCFQQGMATEDVAALLGHANIGVTQKHYSPWMLFRQERLGSIVEAAYQQWTKQSEATSNLRAFPARAATGAD